MLKELKVGNIFKNKSGLEFIILKKLQNNKFKIQFLESGYIKDVRRDHIIDGSIRDKPSIDIGDKFITNSGLEYIILERLPKKRYKIQFLESGNIKEVAKSQIKEGSIRDVLVILPGEHYKNSKGLDFVVLEEISKGRFKIQFTETGHIKEASKYNILNGSVSDPLIVIGEIRTSQSGLNYQIISKINKNYYHVKFIESGYETDVTTSAILSGYIKDKIANKCIYDVGAKFTNNDGLEYEIIKKYDSTKVRIKFLDSGFEDDVWCSHISNGLIRDKSTYNKYTIGKRFYNTNGQEYEIIKQYDSTKFRIRFIETGYEKDTDMTLIGRGTIKDKYSPSVSGVGYLGDFDGIVNDMREYRIWRAMLERCYNENDIGYNSYGGKGTYVCDRWLNFTNFLEDLPTIQGYDKYSFDNWLIELDKDLLQIGVVNKVYSPQTCRFIPTYINTLFRRYPDIPVKDGYIIPASIICK